MFTKTSSTRTSKKKGIGADKGNNLREGRVYDISLRGNLRTIARWLFAQTRKKKGCAGPIQRVTI